MQIVFNGEWFSVKNISKCHLLKILSRVLSIKWPNLATGTGRQFLVYFKLPQFTSLSWVVGWCAILLKFLEDWSGCHWLLSGRLSAIPFYPPVSGRGLDMTEVLLTRLLNCKIKITHFQTNLIYISALLTQKDSNVRHFGTVI